MKDYIYHPNDTHPDLAGVVSYSGNINTSAMSAVLMANDLLTGPFTGAVSRIGGASGGRDLSEFIWEYVVDVSDTAIEAVYKLELRITHATGKIETIPANMTVKVGDT